MSAVQILGVVLLVMTPAASSEAQRRPVTVGVPIAIRTPEPEQLELALDEIELDWSAAGAAGRPLAQQPTAVSGATLIEQAATRSVFRVSGAAAPVDLASLCRALEAANSGAEANFVLYALDSGRDAGTRRVLTRHVALVLEDAADPSGVLVELAARTPQPLEGVPGGFVFETADPLSAMELADGIRDRTGVKAAYALVKRRQFVR